MGRRPAGKYQNGNGYVNEDLPERGPGANEMREKWTGGTRMNVHSAAIYVVAYRDHSKTNGIAHKNCLRDDDVSIEIQQIFLLLFHSWIVDLLARC